MGTFVEGQCLVTYCIELCYLLSGERKSKMLVLLSFDMSPCLDVAANPGYKTGLDAEWETLFSLDHCSRALICILDVSLLLQTEGRKVVLRAAREHLHWATPSAKWPH